MKIGFVSMPFVGHLNPMTTLARRLQSRGHEVTFIGVPDVEPFARAAVLDFVPFCENEYPAGFHRQTLRPGIKVAWRSRSRGGASARGTATCSAWRRSICQQKLADTGVDALGDRYHTHLPPTGPYEPGHALCAGFDRPPP